jgi:hypothetical protein
LRDVRSNEATSSGVRNAARVAEAGGLIRVVCVAIVVPLFVGLHADMFSEITALAVQP